jgi:hypothetical protein
VQRALDALDGGFGLLAVDLHDEVPVRLAREIDRDGSLGMVNIVERATVAEHHAARRELSGRVRPDAAPRLADRPIEVGFGRSRPRTDDVGEGHREGRAQREQDVPSVDADP